MGYLDALKPRLAYDRWDYVRALRAMLPRGKLWNIPLPNESDIRPDSISSSEAFGRITISSGQTFITPDGIVSVESFGFAIVVSEWILQMSGIPSGAAFGEPSINTGVTQDLILTGNGIASAESFGSPTIGFVWLQFCDFETNLCSGWDSEFTSNWSQTTESGEGIAQRATDGTDRLYPPSGQLLTGDFTIEFGIWRSASESAPNNSIHLQLRTLSGTQRLDFAYHDSVTYGVSGYFSPPAGPSEHRCKIVRTGTTIWCYRWTGSSWEREDSWSTPGSSLTNNENLYISVNGATAINGFSYIGIDGTLT